MSGRRGGNSEFNQLGELIGRAFSHLRHLDIWLSHRLSPSWEMLHNGWYLFIARYHLKYASILRAG